MEKLTERLQLRALDQSYFGPGPLELSHTRPPPKNSNSLTDGDFNAAHTQSLVKMVLQWHQKRKLLAFEKESSLRKELATGNESLIFN